MAHQGLGFPHQTDEERADHIKAAIDLAILSEAPREALIASVLYANLAVFAALLLAGEGMAAGAAITYVLCAFLVFTVTSAWIVVSAGRLRPSLAKFVTGIAAILNDAAFAAALVFDVFAIEKSYPNTAISTVATIAYVTLPVSARQLVPFLIGKAIIFGTCAGYILVREDYEYGDIAFIPPIVLGFLLISGIGYWVHARFKEQHRLRQELRLAKDDAETAHDFRRRLFNFVGHDLRQPLAALQYIHFDLRKKLTSEGSSDVLDDADACVQDANLMIEDILQLSIGEERQLALDLEPLNIADVLDHVLAPLRPQAATLNVRFQLDMADAYVVADRALLERVFRNLTTNALKHAPGSNVTFRALIEGALTEVQIIDTGTAIHPSSQSAPQTGFGLGLTLSEYYCREMAGELVIEHGRAGGTACRVRLPTASPPPK